MSDNLNKVWEAMMFSVKARAGVGFGIAMWCSNAADERGRL